MRMNEHLPNKLNKLQQMGVQRMLHAIDLIGTLVQDKRQHTGLRQYVHIVAANQQQCVDTLQRADLHL